MNLYHHNAKYINQNGCGENVGTTQLSHTINHPLTSHGIKHLQGAPSSKMRVFHGHSRGIANGDKVSRRGKLSKIGNGEKAE